MDRPFPPTFRILADINLTGNGYRIQKSVAPLLLALFIDRCSRHNSHYVACFRPLLHRSIVASFWRWPLPRDQPRKAQEERGARRFSPRALAFPSLGASAKNIPLTPQEKKRLGFYARVPLPLQSAAKDERAHFALARRTRHQLDGAPGWLLATKTTVQQPLTVSDRHRLLRSSIHRANEFKRVGLSSCWLNRFPERWNVILRAPSTGKFPPSGIT